MTGTQQPDISQTTALPEWTNVRENAGLINLKIDMPDNIIDPADPTDTQLAASMTLSEKDNMLMGTSLTVWGGLLATVAEVPHIRPAREPRGATPQRWSVAFQGTDTGADARR